MNNRQRPFCSSFIPFVYTLYNVYEKVYKICLNLYVTADCSFHSYYLGGR